MYPIRYDKSRTVVVIAISDAFAKAAAAFTSTPSWYSTFALAALPRAALSGELGNQTAGPPKRLGPPPGGSTCADPPPERTLVSAFDPMIAIDLTRAASSGSREFAFFSNTEAARRLSARSRHP